MGIDILDIQRKITLEWVGLDNDCPKGQFFFNFCINIMTAWPTSCPKWSPGAGLELSKEYSFIVVWIVVSFV